MKERETGSEFEGIGWSAHQTLDGNTGLQLLRHSRGDFFVAGAQNGIAEVFAGFVEIPDAENCAVPERPSPASWGKTYQIQWLRFRPERISASAIE